MSILRYKKPTENQEEDLHELIGQRYSPRAFLEESVKESELELLLEAARWSPSSMNSQPWRFRLAERGTTAFEELWATLMDGNKPWAKNASALIATFVVHDPEKPNSLVSAAHDLGLAVGNMTAQAESLGIGIHQMGGFSKDAMRKHMNLDSKIQPMTVLAVGYYGNPEQLEEPFRSRETATRTRKDLKELML